MYIGISNQALSIITQEHSVKDKPNAQSLKLKEGRIEFKNVTFGYVQNNNLFLNQSVTIYGKQKVGLVGCSGSGKTTFINLICRLFDLESGEILIDDQNISDVTQASIRENIGFISQDLVLFHRSLMENIRYGKLDATDLEVMEAAKKAYAHEFIINIAEGYNSLVGERGIKLSGGQKQRIAIARAIIKNAPILILDEATSSLDSMTERLIQESLATLMKNKTVLVIAHRLSTLLSMERILVFHKGHIVEDGTHEELLAAGKVYAALWNSSDTVIKVQ
jgi:ATP-binding cassette subfamily B protein